MKAVLQFDHADRREHNLVFAVLLLECRQQAADWLGFTFGDAFLAGRATGVIPSDEDLRQSWVRISSTIEPDPAASRAYEPYYRAFRDLYPATAPVVHDLARLQAHAAEEEAGPG